MMTPLCNNYESQQEDHNLKNKNNNSKVNESIILDKDLTK